MWRKLGQGNDVRIVSCDVVFAYMSYFVRMLESYFVFAFVRLFFVHGWFLCFGLICVDRCLRSWFFLRIR